MLDDLNVLKQKDPSGALQLASQQYQQAEFLPEIVNFIETVDRPIYNIVVAGMGGSALAVMLLKTWLKNDLPEPFELVRSYNLPTYVDQDTLVIISSYSGNTEEALACYKEAKQRGARLAVVASGGQLITDAKQDKVVYTTLPAGIQPRYGVIYSLKAILGLLNRFNLVEDDKIQSVDQISGWLKTESDKWLKEVPLKDNLAKQLAMQAVGKTAIFYGGELTAPLAYKWKISWNENAKNLAFWNEYPEFNHNEFIGWLSHPIEKPFIVFDIKSQLENSQVIKRFEISDRLLSGLRPKANPIELAGDNLIKQLLWGSILADFASIYLAILNNIDPTQVDLIEKFKQQLK